MKQKVQFFLTLFTLLFFLGVNSQTKIWKVSNVNGQFQGHSIEMLDKNNSEIIELDFEAFKKQLQNAPLRGLSSISNTIINLPDDKGELQSFRILEAPVFSPSLSAKYPNIKSYVGFSIDNSGAIVRMSISPKGVQTMISYKDKPTVFMQPLKDDAKNYVVYNRLSKTNLPKEEFICSTIDEIVNDAEVDKNNITQRDADDQTLRKFRLAMSVNGEYTTYHGGTVAGALTAINTTMARVNAVFETDMAITFEVQDFPELIYTDAATDPYSGSLSAWNVELQNTLTNTIGNAAYDIGHMFGASGGGGNAGCIGCVCVDDTTSTSDQNKGAGITSPADGIPQGDNFDIDYVAHEIGHQMGALHTWSHASAGGAANIEPGSGSTIMGYAGITSSDIQPHSDPYFSYYSILQITDNVTNTRLCWQANSPVTLTNNPPNASAGSDYTIPQGTAYVLRGSATDADGGDNLMYCWEQNDDGVVTVSNFGPTLTSGAMARSLSPTTSSNRYIPKLSRVVAGQLTETNPSDGGGSDWETVATVGRDLNWALTVRDREPTATGLNGQSSFDLMKITVDATTGPFAVTSQTTNEMWQGSSQTITWDVAGTNAGNVNTPTVNILLSKDGGLTFPYTLASNVPNDGSHNVSIPSIGGSTTTARVIVEGNNNIFYAMNSTNFSVQETEFALSIADTDVSVCSPNDAVYNLTYNTFLGFSSTTTFTATGLPSGATATFNPATATADGTAVTATISGIGSVASGVYNFSLVGTSGAITKSVSASLGVYNGIVGSLTLTSPSDGVTGIPIATTLNWNSNANAASYDVEVSTDNAFSNIISSGNVTTNSYTLSGLNQSTTYYWRVRGKNTCGDGNFSSTFSFTVQDCASCLSSGDTATNIGTILVNFNTINNMTGKTAYSDFRNIKTTVKRGESHDLTVNVNTDGLKRTQTKVWIDWNQDCVFNTSSEEYDLGYVEDNSNIATSNSPISISIPNDAKFGETTMRVTTRNTNPFNITYPTSCMTSFEGEVEDYTITVESATASIEDFAFSGFNLYPNPSTGEFTLNLEVINAEKISVQLFDIRGRLINEKNFFNTNANFSEKINFNHTAKGLYLVKITNGNKQTTRKLVIK